MVPATHRLRRRVQSALAAVTAVAVGSVLAPAPALAAVPVLGTAGNFAVLAGQTVTNTGPSVVTRDLGVSPGSAVTGFPPGIVVDGNIHAGDAVAEQAQVDLTAAYNTAAADTPFTTVGPELEDLTLPAGTYRSAAALEITGTLTLDGQDDPNAVFIFQAGSTLTTASASSVDLINGASACNVYWQVGSSATLGTNSTFIGNILALTSITATTGVAVEGRLLARNGAVTLDTNTITAPPVCAAALPPDEDPPPNDGPPNGPPDLPVTGGGAVPALTAVGAAMVLIGGFLVIFYRRRTFRSPN